jgi:4'-phosphopantetheinyl transferase
VTAAPPAWRLVHRAELPAGNEWLAPAEQEVDGAFRRSWRRDDWRLGRFVLKGLIASCLRVTPLQVMILAAADGAPEAYLDGHPIGWPVSLSHRDGTAVALVAPGATAAGIDIEVVEPRSEAFVREWLHEEEQAAVAGHSHPDLAVALRWSAKEAAAKARREGLRLDVRRAVVVPGEDEPTREGWAPLTVMWRDLERADAGWWKRTGRLIVVVVVTPDQGPPLTR